LAIVDDLGGCWGTNASGGNPVTVGLQVIVEGIDGCHFAWTTSVGCGVNYINHVALQLL
jgi:hypothetical protein